MVGSGKEGVGGLDGYPMQGLVWKGKGKVESATAVGQGMEAKIANIALEAVHSVDTHRRKTLSVRRKSRMSFNAAPQSPFGACLNLQMAMRMIRFPLNHGSRLVRGDANVTGITPDSKLSV